ncbi:MAG: beta-1-3, beta-1-6-glucan biosynthesis protein [Pseudolabrys sp.]
MSRFVAVAGLVVAVLASTPAALAQSGDQKAAEAKAAADAAAKEAQKRFDQIVEAGRMMSGPAANPECVWLGRRVVSLLWRDDMDTAFRHLDLYDRFGCPGAHIQSTFRCLVRQGPIDPKSQESLNGRAHACWINPNLNASEAAATAPTPSAQAPGSTAR